jgi:hypothetical protein
MVLIESNKYPTPECKKGLPQGLWLILPIHRIILRARLNVLTDFEGYIVGKNTRKAELAG